VLNGMAGVFIIEGQYDKDLRRFDQRLKETEKVLIVQNFREAPNLLRGNLSNTDAGGTFPVPGLWVNGHKQPIITMKPGEIQLWRLVNASIRAVTTLVGFTIQNGATPELKQIAQDGVQFSFDNYQSQPFRKTQLTGMPLANTFAPGNRIDVLVKAPLQADIYELRVKDTTTRPPGQDPPEQVLVKLKVEGDPIVPAMEFPSTKEQYPTFPSFLKDIDEQDSDIAKDRLWLGSQTRAAEIKQASCAAIHDRRQELFRRPL
jgi:FtsP/CotA-like multicopper oxidase with cupredoxin domain